MKDFLHHLLFPRESNNHRSKILHHSSLFIVITLLFAATFTFSFVERRFESVLGISTNITVDELLSLTNKIRSENGLSSLSLSGELNTAATSKANDMFAKDYWAHNAPDGTPPWVFVKGAGYNYMYAGENLARGFTTAQDVVNAWMESPGHRENLLSTNYTEIGFAVGTGVLTGDETALVVQMFGSRSNSPTQAQVQPQPTQIALAPSVVPTRIVTRLSPTPFIPTPTVAIQPTAVPTVVANQANLIQVASVQSQPLVNKDTLSKNIAFLLLGVFISLLLLDMIIVERNNIVRFVGHNVDHIIYLIILLLIVLIVTRGTIL